MRWRVSISGCLGAVFVVALGLAALRSASVYWVTAVAWVVLFWLSVAVVGAIFSEGGVRFFWTGFALFGWIYMILVHTSVISTTLSDQMGMGLRRIVDDVWKPSTRGIPKVQLPYYYQEFGQQKIRIRVVCDLLLNLAFALLGGLTALYFAARRDAARQQPPNPPPGAPS